METIVLGKEIKTYYVQATSFPEGVMSAHAEMDSLVPFSTNRRSFGISRPENGEIVYKVAAEELETGELSSLGLKEFVIPKGKYIALTIKDFRRDISSVQLAFDQLIVRPEIDPEGYCIEWYQGLDDVICMVKLK